MHGSCAAPRRMRKFRFIMVLFIVSTSCTVISSNNVYSAADLLVKSLVSDESIASVRKHILRQYAFRYNPARVPRSLKEFVRAWKDGTIDYPSLESVLKYRLVVSTAYVPGRCSFDHHSKPPNHQNTKPPEQLPFD